MVTEKPHKVLGEGTRRPATASAPLPVCQGQWSIAFFCQNVAFQNNWSTASLVDLFLQRLADDMMDMLVVYERPTTLDDAIKPPHPAGATDTGHECGGAAESTALECEQLRLFTTATTATTTASSIVTSI